LRKWQKQVTNGRIGSLCGVHSVFAEDGTPDTAFVADIYEHISFLGDLHQQIATLPEGTLYVCESVTNGRAPV